MPKITDEPLVKTEQTLFASDYEVLKRLYGGHRGIGVNKVIRTLVRTYVRKIGETSTASIDQIESLDVTSEDLKL